MKFDTVVWFDLFASEPEVTVLNRRSECCRGRWWTSIHLVEPMGDDEGLAAWGFTLRRAYDPYYHRHIHYRLHHHLHCCRRCPPFLHPTFPHIYRPKSPIPPTTVDPLHFPILWDRPSATLLWYGIALYNRIRGTKTSACVTVLGATTTDNDNIELKSPNNKIKTIVASY